MCSFVALAQLPPHPSEYGRGGETNVSEMIEGGVTRQIDPSQSNNRCAVLCVCAIDRYDID